MATKLVIVDRTSAILKSLRTAVGAAVDKAGDDMAQHMRDEMEAAKSGASYDGHQASAPGEAPANWHDALIGTIENEKTGSTSTVVSAGSDAAPYLRDYLEHGSPGGKIAPRPLVAPAADLAKAALAENVLAAIREELR